jgi:hypothetical protein
MRISESKDWKVRAGLTSNREGHKERNFGDACATQSLTQTHPEAASNVFCESFAFQHEALT